MEQNNGSIFFYCNKTKYILSLIVCLLCAVFALFVIIKMSEFKLLAYASIAFFTYKSGVYIYEIFYNKRFLIELKKDVIVIDGCPPLPLADIEVVGQKRITAGSSEMLYVCLKTDESKFTLTERQKDNLALGLTAFCFRPAVLARKDADFLINELLKHTKQEVKKA